MQAFSFFLFKLIIDNKVVQRDLLKISCLFTVSGFPPGINMYVDIMAYKNEMIGTPFTISLRTFGKPHETLNLTAILLKEKVCCF